VVDEPVAGHHDAGAIAFIAWTVHLVRDRLRTGFEIDRVWVK
jgi:hypothetical protein